MPPLPDDPSGDQAALEADDLTPEEVEAIRESQADPDTPPADDPEVG